MNKNSVKMNLEEKEQLEWQQIKTPSTVINRRSSHSSCMYNDKLYIYGGYDNCSPTIIKDLFRYCFKENKWEQIEQKGELPGQRHSHSAIVYKDKMYVYGGMYEFMHNTNKLHAFDFDTNTWTLVETINTPPAIDSHRCCLYGNEMIVGLGYSEYDFSANIYSLDLDTFTWKTIFCAEKSQEKYPEPRTQASFCLQNNQILIYGGKDTYDIFNDLWSFDLISCKYTKIDIQNNEGRYGHSAIIDNNKLYIFGGTRGVTHERNDLVVIDLPSKVITTCWNDSQQERRKFKQESSNPLLKKSRRDSAKKGINWSIFFEAEEEEEEKPQKSPGKYRTQLKEGDYYNSLYERPQKENSGITKHKKNPLLKELNRSNSSEGDGFNLTATFQILTNSIVDLSSKTSGKEEKYLVESQYWRKIPKARDNSSAEIRKTESKTQMIIFGGGMHKIGFNDLIKIDLNQLNQKYLALEGQE